MKKCKNIAVNTGIYLLYMCGACLVVMLLEALVSHVVGRFVVLSYPALTILRIVIYTVGVPAVLAALGYFEGYHEASISVPETLGSGLLALIPHALFGILFGFQGFITGSVRFTAAFIRCGMGVTYDKLLDTPYWLFLTVFLVYGLLYAAVLTLSKYLGAKKRLISRGALRRNEAD